VDEGWNKYDLYDNVSWCIGLLLLPLAILWRCYKLVKQLATDT
jgi:hypothetical protein